MKVEPSQFNKPMNFLNKIGFHKYNAKSTGESLLMHSYNTYFVLSKLIEYIPNLTKDDKIKLKIASLIHDYGKTYKEYQDKLYGPHKLKEEDIPKVKELILKTRDFNSDYLDDIIYIIQNHHSINLEKVNSERDKLTRIVSICDNIVSSQDINEEVINTINGLIDSIDYECFAVELIEHPISSYVIGSFDYIFKNNGIEPILFSKNGTIYIKPKKQKIPHLQEINKFLNERINEEFASKGILVFANTNFCIYTNNKDFLFLAKNISKFLEVSENDIQGRLTGFKNRSDWTEKKREIYLFGRVCGTVYNSLIDVMTNIVKNLPEELKKNKEFKNVLELLKKRKKAPFSAELGGRANEKTVEFIKRLYGRNKLYKLILKYILEDFKEEINIITKSIESNYNIKDLLARTPMLTELTGIDIQEEARTDYTKYWDKDPINICRICHTFKQESTPAALFPISDLGGGKDAFLTDLMRRSMKFKDKGGVCKWCKLWFMLLKNKTHNRMYKLSVFPHALFGRIDWDEIFESDNTILIGSTIENFIYPHVAVIGLSGRKYADFISQAVKNKLLDKLYENGLRGKVISTLAEKSSHLFDCGGIKIKVDEYPLFKPILDNIIKGKESNNYALAVKSMKNNIYSWGYLIKTKKLKGDANMVKELSKQTGLSFLKNIWVGGSGDTRISNAEKIVRRMNETLRKLKDKEEKDVVIDAMVSIGRKISVSTRESKDWSDKRRQKEVDSLKKMAEKLYEYRESGAQRTELVRAMSCYLGYVPYTIEE